MLSRKFFDSEVRKLKNKYFLKMANYLEVFLALALPISISAVEYEFKYIALLNTKHTDPVAHKVRLNNSSLFTLSYISYVI